MVRDRVRASAQESRRDGATHLSFHAMATQCRVAFAAPAPAAKAFMQAALQWVADFESRYSRFLPGSLISRINRAAGREWVEIDAETQRIFSLCDEGHFITRGVFDPTALPLIQLWNWKASPPVLPDDAAIEAARALVGWRQVQRAPGKIFLPREGMSLDLGGIGKEYAVDCVAQLALQHGIGNALVDFGQDVFGAGTPPDGKPAWHIGLEDPKKTGRCWAGVAVRNQAVATSGDYVRRFELNGRRYGHILDARTGRPVANGCLAVSVIAPRCTLAGLLSTSVFVLGPQEGIRLLDSIPHAEGCVITETEKIHSRRFHEHVVS